jgi:hypothetical protein
MTFTTPGGSTSRRISPNISVLSGVKGEGLVTSVFPASSPGAIFQRRLSLHGSLVFELPLGRFRSGDRAMAG